MKHCGRDPAASAALGFLRYVEDARRHLDEAEARENAHWHLRAGRRLRRWWDKIVGVRRANAYALELLRDPAFYRRERAILLDD